MNTNIIVIGTVLMLLSGCSSSYKQNELKAPAVKLEQGVGVLISTPENGKYDQKEYKKSGSMTANALRGGFSKNANDVSITTECKGKSCLDTVNSEKYGYYVEAIILHWEDRATEWSGKEDKLEIQIIIYDTKTKKEIGNTTYSSESKWLSLGGDHPQDLLEEPINEYINNLYK